MQMNETGAGPATGPGPGGTRIQCAFALWGEKFGAGHVNALVEQVGAQCSRPVGFTLICDRRRPAISAEVEQVELDPYWQAPRFRGTHASQKLALFEAGVLAAGRPAVYLDLDTLVRGDIARLAALAEGRRALWLCPGHILPSWRVPRLAAALSRGRHAYFANSSVAVFYPEDCRGIPEFYRAAAEADPTLQGRLLRSSDRAISWAARGVIRVIPDRLAVKFVNEYMAHLAPWARLKHRLPWVRARRAGLVAVTFPGAFAKPEALMALEAGSWSRDQKGRWLHWSERSVGGLIGEMRARAAAQEA